MKQCTKCLKSKDKTEFSKKSNTADKLNNRCRQCCKEIDRENYLKNPNVSIKRAKKRHNRLRLSYWIVYLLPQHNYVGMTNNPVRRMYNHKNLGRDTSGWVELHRFNTWREARRCEDSYHKQGYMGMKSKKQVISVLN
jgi:hypothetical protein